MNDKTSENLSGDLQTIRDYCLERDLKIAVAESVTAGFVQVFLSNMPDAGRFFQGGITTYTLEMKNKLLNISISDCESTNGVGSGIADLMAKNITALFNAEIGLAITGYAAAVPELGITDKFAFGSIWLCGSLVARCRFISREATQQGAQRDFAAQLIHQCSRCIDRISRREEFRLTL